jgi:CHASE3 domain sensor protein
MPLLAVALLSICFLILIAFILWSSRWTQRTERMLAQLSETEKLIVDMETGIRGYAIWRDRRFLEPYLAATSLQDGSISLLDENAPDDIAARRVVELRLAVDEWAEWAESIRARIEREESDAPIDEGLEGKRLMDRVRGVLAEMTRAEFARRDTARAYVRSIVLITMIGSIVLTVLAAAFLLHRWRRTLRDTAATYTQAIRLSRKQGKELDDAYRRLDREIKAVADIQRSLLPRALPEIPGLSIAAHYETSTRVGGASLSPTSAATARRRPS